MKSLIIIPTFNEEKNIKEIVPEILELKKGFYILIVDDNSPDKTGETADELSQKYSGKVFVLHRKEKSGLGKAYIDGFRWALKKDYDLIFQMDADGSHSPKFLPDFLEKIKKYDLVIGSRYYKGKIRVKNWGIKRLFLSLLGNFYARIITRMPISDATAGFKCFRRKVLEIIDLDNVLSEGYSFQIEVNWRAYKSGFKIGEIPIIFYERKYGESKMSANIIKEALWVLWKIKFKKNLINKSHNPFLSFNLTKNNLKKIILIFIVAYYLFFVPFILYYYSIYLNRPDDDTWNQTEKYLTEPEKYNNEPVIFKPDWLKNYATDFGRFQKFNIAKNNNNFYTYWLITTDSKSIPKDYKLITVQKINKLFIFELRKAFR